MTIGTKPPGEVRVDLSLVRALIQEQHADLAHLPLVEVGAGWDNHLFRAGENFAVRLPRRLASAALIEQEQRWLPRLSSRLPLPVPVPLRVGRPGCGFPWSWSVVPWLPGESALATPPHDLGKTTGSLGRFLEALHQPAPDAAPRNPWRGVPLAARAESLREHLTQVGGVVDRTAALELWERALSAPPWSGPAVWIHGDLHPGNLLVDGGRLSAVIDFGDLAAGDPATDLSVLWMLPSRPAPSGFVAAARRRLNLGDDGTWMRARGWALALGLAYLANSRDDHAMAALGRATIDSALRDSP